MMKLLQVKLMFFYCAIKQKSCKCDNQLINWWTGITRPADSWNLVTLKTNFAQYKNFVCVPLKKYLVETVKIRLELKVLPNFTFYFS